MLLVNKRGLFMTRLNTLGASEATSDKIREMHWFEILKKSTYQDREGLIEPLDDVERISVRGS